jgi:site-specific DNA-methyltransferase (adenine-specific)
MAGGFGGTDAEPAFYGDSGSAARFFYCAKAGKLDRLGSDHPTVKPVALMRWLVRLVTPPRGLVLDPSAGTGSTAIAAFVEGFPFVMCELRPEAVADIERRLAHIRGLGRTTALEMARLDGKGYAKARGDDLPLFGATAL